MSKIYYKQNWLSCQTLSSDIMIESVFKAPTHVTKQKWNVIGRNVS